MVDADNNSAAGTQANWSLQPEAAVQRAGGWRAQDAWANANGLRESKSDACPRVVIGKRCLRYTSSCVCESDAVRSLFDHQRIWLTDSGARVLTTEPYHCEPSELERLMAALEPIGIKVETASHSPWNPGITKLIVLTEADQRPAKVRPVAAVGWTDVEKAVRRASAYPVRRTDAGRRRRYEITFPWAMTGGPGNDFLSVSVQLNQQWSQISLDRIGILPECGTDAGIQLAAEAGPWYAENLSPYMTAAREERKNKNDWWTDPQGDGVYQIASPVRRDDVVSILELWIPQEIAWAERLAAAGRRGR